MLDARMEVKPNHILPIGKKCTIYPYCHYKGARKGNEMPKKKKKIYALEINLECNNNIQPQCFWCLTFVASIRFQYNIR